MPPAEPAVILSACRTPIGTFGGALKDVGAAHLGAVVIRNALCRSAVDPGEVGDVIMGCVLQAGGGMNVARQAALEAGVPQEVPAETVNRVCGSGLQAVAHAVEGVRAGSFELAVAGGIESMSSAPYLLTDTRWGRRMGHGEVLDAILVDGLTCAILHRHMGTTAEEISRRFQISRQAQDACAAESQRRAASAIANGSFTDEIVAVDVPHKRGAAAVPLTADEHPRADTTVEKLAALKPVFVRDGGTVTPGNSSGLNDGAAALVVASRARAEALGRQPLATVVSYASAGVDPAIMGMGAAAATRKALARARLDVEDIDLFELNEAFAAQAVAVLRELRLDPAKVNVHGGAIALGHPIGASGARVLTTLIYALRARGGGTGLAALCIGGGMGIAMIVDVAAA